MTFVDVLIIAFGGFLGAILRYLLAKRFNGKNPLGTLIANMSGSLFIGIIFGLSLPIVWTMFLVSGFAGALTTFSTLQKEIIEEWQAGRKKETIYYIVVTYIGGILLAFIGYLTIKS